MKNLLGTIGFWASTLVWIVAYFSGDLQKATFFLILSLSFPINKLFD